MAAAARGSEITATALSAPLHAGESQPDSNAAAHDLHAAAMILARKDCIQRCADQIRSLRQRELADYLSTCRARSGPRQPRLTTGCSEARCPTHSRAGASRAAWIGQAR